MTTKKGGLGEWIHSHLSDDETVAKMGHPNFGGGLGESGFLRFAAEWKYNKNNCKSKDNYGDSSLRSE